MVDRRSIEEVRADAHVVKRERVLRWLTRIAEYHAERADTSTDPAVRVREASKAHLAAELVNDFVNGRER